MLSQCVVDERVRWMSFSTMQWRKYFVLFGVFLINVPNGVTWYYGNLSSYTACVFRKRQGSNIETPWLMSVEVACWTMGIILGGLLDSRLGPRWTMFLGAFLFNISFFMTYLTFELTFVTFILSLGVLTGVADGILHSASLSYIVMWVDSNVGLAIGLTTSSLGLGAVLINLIITRYINPLNLNPDATDGNLRIFTQEDILERVPQVFLILGTFNSVFHFLGFVFLQSRKSRDNRVKCLSALISSGQPRAEVNKSGLIESIRNPKNPLTAVSPLREPILVVGEETGIVSDTCADSDTTRLLRPPSYEPSEDIKVDVDNGNKGKMCKLCRKCNISGGRKDRPGILGVFRQMVKTKELYVLVMLQFSMDYALVVVSHFYKLFGQTWLSDDRVLAILGTVMTVTTIFPKFFLGALQDRIGLKETWIIMTSGTTITAAFWNYTPKVNKWMFFVWTICITWFVCAFDSLVVAGVVEIYGTYRCNLKYGIVAAFSTILQLSASPMMSEILETFEWAGLFLSVSCLHCVSLIISVLVLPRGAAANESKSDLTKSQIIEQLFKKRSSLPPGTDSEQPRSVGLISPRIKDSIQPQYNDTILPECSYSILPQPCDTMQPPIEDQHTISQCDTILPHRSDSVQPQQNESAQLPKSLSSEYILARELTDELDYIS